MGSEMCIRDRVIRRTRQVIASALAMLGGAVLGTQWSEIQGFLGIGGGFGEFYRSYSGCEQEHCL